MLIVKNLKKTYKTKGGVEVHALDDVSVTFPESGMVFLLGKSGSGKSTLLNMIGGLDRVDSGEIIVKGKNSKTFSGSDYDSYRNTFIGFIFQEYNILNEFNVEQNISLALQLQGKPNDKKVVEEILEQVDLKGLGKRKPNTLSGGQKQRVAIARALIKNPEIIMADEPTGALDSNTGKQVFETLKKLSKDKLVIVVSHDRDFAEYYGDRIIELSDGKIISDTSKEYITPEEVSSNVHVINDHTLAIKNASKLSEDDLKQIAKVLKKTSGEAVITSGEHDLTLVRQAIHINTDNSSEVFNETGEVETKEYDGSKTRFTKSKLPFSRAFKMGSSSLKLKPIRFIFTTFLTVTALVMFGLTSTLMLFKESYSVYKALKNADYDAEVVSKYYKYTNNSYGINIDTGEKSSGWSYDSQDTAYFDDNEIKELNKNSVSLKYAGLITFGREINSASFNITNAGDITNYENQYILGFCEADKNYLNNSNMSIISGEYPTKADEILVSKYQFDTLKVGLTGITTYESLVGNKVTLSISGNAGALNKKFTVTGIYDAGRIPEKYEKLKDPTGISSKEVEKLSQDFKSYLSSSFQKVVFVNTDFYDEYQPTLYYYQNSNKNYINGLSLNGVRIQNYYSKDDFVSPSDMAWNIGTEKFLDYVTPDFYDLEGNKISYVAPKDGQVYSRLDELYNAKTQQESTYFTKAGNMIDYRYYNQELSNLVSGHEDEYNSLINRLRDSAYNKGYYPEDYSYTEDKAKVDNLMNTYYVDVISKAYLMEQANRLISGFSNEVGWDQIDSYPDLKTFNDNVSDANGNPATYDNYSGIKSYVSSDSHSWLKHYNLIDYAMRAIDTCSEEERQRAEEIQNKYWNQQSISSSEYEFLETICNRLDLSSGSISYNESWITVDTPLKASHAYYKTSNGASGELEVIGYVSGFEYFLKHDYAKSLGTIADSTIYINEQKTSYKEVENPKYNYVITPTNYTQGQIDHMIKKNGSYGYSMTDSVYINLQLMLSLITTLKTVFLIVGAVCGVFAALMLLNFISTSIAAKTKEIGILRAVGARGSDLFKIFFSESGLIAAICSVIAIIGSGIACWRLNVMMAEEVGISLLDFNILNIGLILAGAVLITILGTLIPVIIAAKKPPVESIRSL